MGDLANKALDRDPAEKGHMLGECFAASQSLVDAHSERHVVMTTEALHAAS